MRLQPFFAAYPMFDTPNIERKTSKSNNISNPLNVLFFKGY